MALPRNYRVPRMVVRQRFVDDGGASAVAAAVHISGPHANFVSRGTSSFEQGLLGTYSEATGLSTWLPTVLQDNVLDVSSMELVFTNAALQYFSATTESFSIPENSRNVVDALDPGFSFTTYGSTDRYFRFENRDVQIGDLVRLTAVVGGETEIFWSSIARLLPKYIPGEIDILADPALTNAPLTAAGSSILVANEMPGIDIDVDGIPGADLLEKGLAEATYTVQVTIGGDTSSARFRVLASNGEIENGVIVSSIGELTSTLVSGVTLTFSDSASGPLTFAAGTFAVFKVSAAYSPVTVTTAGDYTVKAVERAAKETTYTITVIRGGEVPLTPPVTELERASRPVLSVTTNTGLDQVPSVRVDQAGTPIDIGRYGIQINVPAGYLITGDKFTVKARSSYSNAVSGIGLNDNLPQDWISSTATAVHLELFLNRPELVISAESGADDWTIEGNVVRVRPNIMRSDPAWWVGGEMIPMPLVARSTTKAYLTFRYFVSDLAGTITQVTTLAELDDLVSGPVDSSNPLKYAAYHALAGGEGSQVLLTAVADPADITEWEKVTDLISERDDVFHVFPLCYGDKQITDLFYRHIQEMNVDEVAKERLLYLVDYTPETIALAQGIEGLSYEGVFSEEVESGVEYIAFTSNAPEVDFRELGVRRGDVLRTNFVYDLSGKLVWSDYVIAEVMNSSTVRIENTFGLDVSDTGPRVFEVWRHQLPREQREVIADTAGIQDMLVRYIMVDNVDKSVDPLGPASTFVGLVGSVVPHQGVSWYPLPGWSVDGWQGKYSNADLNHMAGNGVTVITRHADGFVAARHAVTTAKAPLAGMPETLLSLKMSEEMYIRNALLIKKEFRNALRGFVGVTNLVEGTRAAIEANLYATSNYLKNSNEYPTLGGRITSDIQDLVLREHILHRDTLIVSFKVECPFALNTLDCTLYMS